MDVVDTDGAPPAAGPYSQAVAARGFVLTAGMIPVDPATGTVPEGIAAQTALVLDNLAAVLEAGGCGLGDVVRTTVILTDMGMFGTVNGIYAERFAPPYPARTCFAAAGLPKGVLIMVDAVAAVPGAH